MVQTSCLNTYEASLTQLAAKETRVQKRVRKSYGKPVCCFCSSKGDYFLFVHLKNNKDCEREYMDKYRCKDVKELHKLFREKAKLRKIEKKSQRDTVDRIY